MHSLENRTFSFHLSSLLRIVEFHYKLGCKEERCTSLPHYYGIVMKLPLRGSIFSILGFLVEEAL